jgi:hypothetical protein
MHMTKIKRIRNRAAKIVTRFWKSMFYLLMDRNASIKDTLGANQF